MLSNLFVMFFGAMAGWFGTHFFTRPLLKAYEYREKVHEFGCLYRHYKRDRG